VKIRYRPASLAQLDRIFTYVAEQNPDAAGKVLALLKRSIDRLADFPFSGRPSEMAGIRELPIVRYPYIVFYTVNDARQEVVILRVRQASQDPAHHLDRL
jgi:toxin ParE1/3/4